MKEINNRQDLIDSRDIDQRIKDLEEERTEFILNESQFPDESPSWGEVAEANAEAESKWEDTEEGEELAELKALKEELEGYSPDWRYGSTLIRDSYFKAYAKELIEDIGDMPSGLPFYIENNINWDGVAEDLQVDYTSAEFDGVTYWVRS